MKKVILTHVYQKPGAVFANSLEAFFDKNSLLPSEIKQQISDTNALINERGVYSQPMQYLWDQDSFQLTIRRFINDLELWQSCRQYKGNEIDSFSEQAGWTLVSRTAESV